MMTNINTPMLHNITQEIRRGRPFWALLRANEWAMSESDVVANALRRSAAAVLAGSEYDDVRDMVTLMLKGARLNDLTTEQQLRARNVREIANADLREIPTIPAFRTRVARRALPRVSRFG